MKRTEEADMETTEVIEILGDADDRNNDRTKSVRYICYGNVDNILESVMHKTKTSSGNMFTDIDILQ